MLLRKLAGQAFHLARDAFEGGLCAVAAHFARKEKAGLAQGQGADRAAAEGALDHVALPVAGDKARVCQGSWSDRGDRAVTVADRFGKTT